MKREDLGQLRQSKGYSMNMMAEFLGGTLEEYAELEFGVIIVVATPCCGGCFFF